MKKTAALMVIGILSMFIFLGSVHSASAATITSVNKTYSKYTTATLGFSINFPKFGWFMNGGCAYSTANGDHSYRPKMSKVPVLIFAQGSMRIISPSYYYQLTGAKVSNGIYYYSGCKKVTNSTALIFNSKSDFSQLQWRITVKTVNNDKALTKLIKKQYGSGCTWSKKKSAQKGVYDVSIVGDGKDFETTLCPVNYITVIKYYPAKHKVAYWDIGQAYTFFSDKNNSKELDDTMVKSFRFL